MNAAQLFFGHRQHFGERVTQRVNALGMRPDRHQVVIESGDRTRWTNRTMHQVTFDVRRAKGFHGRCRWVPLVRNFNVRGGQRLELLMNDGGIGQRVTGRPFTRRRQSPLREDGLPFIGCHDRNKVAVAYDLEHAWHLQDRLVIHLEQRCAVRGR